MSAGQLFLLLLLLLVAAVLIVVVLRRGSAQRDAQRVEAAGLRSEADTLASTLPGQSAFAEQAAQRAEIARVEAEEKAREAQRLEAEAAAHRATVEATQRDYEATMRRADDIDPDVKESAFPAAAGSTDAAPAAGATAEGDLPMTRAERREAREAEAAGTTVTDATSGSTATDSTDDATMVGTTDGSTATDSTDDATVTDTTDDATATDTDGPSAASSVPAAGAAATGAAAAGAGAWGADDDASPESRRIASAADYRDDVAEEPADVYAQPGTGSGADMSDDTRTGTSEQTTREEGLGAGEVAATASAGLGGAYVATRALHEEQDRADEESARADEETDRADGRDATSDDRDETTAPAADVAADVESPRGEWGGPHDATTEPEPLTVIGEPEAYASTEPVMAEDQSPPVSPEPVATTEGGSSSTADVSTDDVPTDDTHRSAADVADVAEEPAQERFEPTPTRDWSADEGALLAESSERGDRLEAERTELAAQEDDGATGTPAPDDVATSETGTAGDDTAADDGAPEQPAGRRISEFNELRDGGFGVGSAAPLDDGAQPLDHPVQGYRDTMTYRVPGDPGYDSAEPHVWFYDEGAAERSGFRRSDG